MKSYCKVCGGLNVVRTLWRMFSVIGCKKCKRVKW